MRDLELSADRLTLEGCQIGAVNQLDVLRERIPENPSALGCMVSRARKSTRTWLYNFTPVEKNACILDESIASPAMKASSPFAPLLVLTSVLALSTMTPARADNLEHTQKLLSSRECAGCDLTNAGLIYAKLSNANLVRADLSGANLSWANLQGADLRGANLTGASLHGANLVGAKLDGAILRGTDLRNAYLNGITYEGAVIEGSYLQGAVGLPTSAGSAADFFAWAIQDAKLGNHVGAVQNFSQALDRNPKLAQAYLGRSVSRAHTSDREGAIGDAEKAEQLFTQQGDAQSAKFAQAFVKQLKAPPPSEPKNGNGIGTALLSVLGTVLQFLTLF